MIAVDTNVIVYSHAPGFEQHEVALAALTALAEGPAPWGLPVFVVSEFLRVVTHPRVLDRPSRKQTALAVIDALLASPTVRLLTPGERYWRLLADAVVTGGATGNDIHDAAICALCREAGANQILSEDRALGRYPGVDPIRLERFTPST